MDLWANYLSKIDVQGPDECWDWLYGTDRDGYGIFSWRADGKSHTKRATRFGWEQRFGPIEPPSMLVCHTCDRPPCQNHAHWFLGTTKVNNADCVRKGRDRQVRGEAHYRATLTDVQVAEIRTRFTGQFGQMAALGREYGVHRRTISKLIHGERRVH